MQTRTALLKAQATPFLATSGQRVLDTATAASRDGPALPGALHERLHALSAAWRDEFDRRAGLLDSAASTPNVPTADGGAAQLLAAQRLREPPLGDSRAHLGASARLRGERGLGSKSSASSLPSAAFRGLRREVYHRLLVK